MMPKLIDVYSTDSEVTRDCKVITSTLEINFSFFKSVQMFREYSDKFLYSEFSKVIANIVISF